MASERTKKGKNGKRVIGGKKRRLVFPPHWQPACIQTGAGGRWRLQNGGRCACRGKLWRLVFQQGSIFVTTLSSHTHTHTLSLSGTAPFIERAFHVWCFGLRKIQNEWVTPTQRGDISTAITLWLSPISLLKIWWISAGFVRGLSYPTSPVEANLRPAEIRVKER